ncbi:hypothetical protein TD95_003589 [Thielaviopsis punctulata]|uniref:Nucleoporin NUP37 n=1 Tax=Thielaviopsis punctulata TaxID=72032 RepID=A0A0F4Z8I4_9PEZI|nr:hypothetical protein TD95_003589 [Thielaviopsis punctulata]
MALGAPRIRRTAQNTQFSYDLSRRVYNVKTYPILSPQGATILIYGHENGFAVVWRGGRRLKTKRADAARAEGSKTKKKGADAVVLLDSDDDEPMGGNADPKGPFVDTPEFEIGTVNDPYPEIIQTLDLALGTPVTHIAVVPMTPTQTTDETTFTGIEQLKEKMVFAIACGTNDVYLVSLPLTPPSHESKSRPELKRGLLSPTTGAGFWGETLILLSGQLQPSRGLAVTLVKPKSSEKATTKPRLVVASHTREASGVLRLWEAALSDAVVRSRPIDPFQVENLPHTLKSISFNSTHNTQLMAVAPQHGVRIYDFATSPFPADELLNGPFPSQGSWQLSLLQPFAKGLPVRKSIVDAVWIAYGRAVMVLLADGTWGIWDMDGVSPMSSSVLGKNASGIIGGGITQFSVSGQIEGTASLRAGAVDNKTHRNGTPASMSSAFGPGRMASIAGGISVTAIPGPLGSGADESVVLWISSWEHICVIPGIMRFWDSQLRRQSGGGVNLFSGAQPTRMLKLQELSVGLMGEQCVAVVAIAQFDKARNENHSGLPVEVVVLGESRLVFIRESEDVSVHSNSVAVRKRFGKRNSSSALVVDRPDITMPMITYNLNPGKAGTIRTARAQPDEAETAQTESAEATALLGPPASAGASFQFMDTLNAAADVNQEAPDSRDIEVEMLDIMEIDRELDNMEDYRDGSRKRVMFDDSEA